MGDRNFKRGGDAMSQGTPPPKLIRDGAGPSNDFKKLLLLKVREKSTGIRSVPVNLQIPAPPARLPVAPTGAFLNTRALSSASEDSDSDDERFDTTIDTRRSVVAPPQGPPLVVPGGVPAPGPAPVPRVTPQPMMRPPAQPRVVIEEEGTFRAPPALLTTRKGGGGVYAGQRLDGGMFDTERPRATVMDDIRGVLGNLSKAFDSEEETEEESPIVDMGNNWEMGDHATRGSELINTEGIKGLNQLIANTGTVAKTAGNREFTNATHALSMISAINPQASVRGGVFRHHNLTGGGSEPFRIEGCELITGPVQEVPIPFRHIPAAPFGLGTIITKPSRSPKRVIALDRKTTQQIGRGSFCEVFKVGNLACKFQRGVKMAGVSNTISDVIEETVIASRLSHPNIITLVRGFLYHGGSNKEAICVSLWELGLMDMYTFTQQAFWAPGPAACEPITKRFIARSFEKHTLMGLEYLHARGLMHRDVKPQNVFIFNNGQHLVAKLGDLGCCAKGAFCDAAGTLGYFAPETLAINVQCCASDMWAWALTMWELHAGRGLFMDGTRVSLHRIFNVLGGFDNRLYNIMAMRKTYMLPTDATPKAAPDVDGYIRGLRADVSESFIEILKSVLRLNPNNRATARDLLKSERYKDPVLMNGCVPTNVAALQATAPDAITLPEFPTLPLQMVISSAGEGVSDRLAEKVHWGQAAMELTSDYRPTFLYSPWLGGHGPDELVKSKQTITLTDMNLVLAYPVITKKDYGIEEVRIYEHPALPKSTIAIMLKLKDTVSLDGVNKMMLKIQDLQVSLPYLLPVLHYSVAQSGREKFLMYVTTTANLLSQLSIDGTLTSGLSRGVVLLKQLVAAILSFNSHDIKPTADILTPQFIYHNPAGLDMGPIKIDLVAYLLTHHHRTLDPMTIKSKDNKSTTFTIATVQGLCIAAHRFVASLMAAPRSFDKQIPSTMMKSCDATKFFGIPMISQVKIPTDERHMGIPLLDFIKLQPSSITENCVLYSKGFMPRL
ncbi:ORF73 [Silurid herpesvirus 1]|nr:ORF73 [Silurid herpesvirus 1]